MIRNRHLAAAAVALTAALGTGPARAADPVVEAQNRLGVELAAALVSEAGAKGRNQVVSPFILSSTLGLLYIGAEGEVQAALNEALGFGGEGFSKFRDLSRKFDATPEVSVATNLWFDNDSAPIRSGLIALKQEFDLEPKPIDFGAKEAVAEINGWIEKQTNGAIRNVVERLSKDTDLVAASALHFKGTWMFPFDKEATRPATFHAAGGKAQEVPFMQRQDSAILVRQEENGFKAVDLPYKDDRFRFVALLPPEGTKTLQSVVTKKSDEEIAGLLGWLGGEKFEPKDAIVSLPKMTLHAACDCLPIVKRSLGFEEKRGRRAKQVTRLVFPGLTTSELSEIRLASMLTIDEEGTEAAAIGVGSTTRSVENKTVEITFDRPFLVALREKESGLILFLALVQDLGDQKTASN